jgi:D-aminoacyl-tRNA deacylase
MKVVLQRVSEASVSVGCEVIAQIANGLLVLACIETYDTEADVDYMAAKIPNLRIFDDPDGKMNVSLLDSNGSLLLVSQFTLTANAAKGNRPSYTAAARPDQAKPLLDRFSSLLVGVGLHLQHGRFGANMQVSLVNDGPVTIILDSANRHTKKPIQ